jgi:hypothetical protein
LVSLADKLLNRFDTLMKTEMDSESCRKLQKRYSTYYREIYKNYLHKHAYEEGGKDSSSQSSDRLGESATGQPRPASF